MENQRVGQPVKMLPPPGSCASSRGYIPAHGMATSVRPEDVEDLLAEGWRLVDTAPPPAMKPLPPVTAEDLRRWAPQPQPGEKTLRCLIPARSKHLPQTVFGCAYPAPSGPVMDAPEPHARALAANGGWMILGQVGTTGERPATPKQWDRFIDTSIEAELVFDGAAWCHTVTGEVV